MAHVKTDLNIFLTEPKNPHVLELANEVKQAGHVDDPVLIHLGFQNAVLAVREQLLAVLEELVLHHGVGAVWCTGHSLGGALATLFAVELRQAFRSQGRSCEVCVCTFGSPRVGNAAFGKLFHFAAGASVRIVCGEDPFPTTPMAMGGYRHVSGLVRIHSNGWMIVRPSLLEELLRSLTPSLWVLICFRLNIFHIGPKHFMRSYVGALRAVRDLERPPGLSSRDLNARRGWCSCCSWFWRRRDNGLNDGLLVDPEEERVALTTSFRSQSLDTLARPCV